MTLATQGYAVLAAPAEAPHDPWLLVERLAGVRPRMVERQAIRPLPGGTSFAASSGFTPFHTDSQDYLGAPPALQVMICRRAAPAGGATRLVDGWALLEQLERDDHALFEALFAVARHHRFYFGDVRRPTVVAAGLLAWTHSPLPPSDPIGRSLDAALARAPVIELPIRDGEILLVDNHRMLHGRTAFTGERDFTRLLAWLPAPLAEHPRYGARVARRPAPTSADARLAAVLELVLGAPPARIAAREGISEAELYAWRTRALAAARDALDD
ncbi:MAG: TauD/TfdA family dioxygenase [Deltaproteobacteria bacterium]|nr:TauD/TfdA family dioxygenase [Deltaproteobacteria bacterium]MCW5809156.1 TauD/TfdA family dioxygenase [Deltaproteobacteria bacterium]